MASPNMTKLTAMVHYIIASVPAEQASELSHDYTWLETAETAMEKSQLDFYKEVQSELLKNYANQIIAVKDGVCLGSYKTRVDALRDMESRGFKNGTYLIILCTPGEKEYTTFFANSWLFASRAVAHGC